MKTYINIFIISLMLLTSGCSDFFDGHAPQGSMDNEQLNNPEYVDNLVISAYAVWISAEDINSSFSMWNYDVRSDDAYKGGNGTEDGDVFHNLEVSQGIMTTAWNISDMWQRLYNCISRANAALQLLDQMDETAYSLKQQRIAEMRFLRGHGHFLLKQLFKKIVIANDENMSPEEYLYKAYRQDNPETNEVTSINEDDLKNVVKYTEETIMTAGGYGLESDFHNNFRPEPEYENGKESLWAMQYSINDGTTNGNCNWSNGLIVPNIPGVTDGGCDFYKPSQNLVNAFKTTMDGYPMFDNFNDVNYNMTVDNADPRLFLTVGMPGLPYEFNPKYMMAKTSVWSRSNGLYGYYVTLKQNVDPDSQYLVKGSWWGTSMNHIVIRYADVLLMRAEALIQLNDGRISEAMGLINKIRNRAKTSTTMIANYEDDYSVKFSVEPYSDTDCSQAEALKRLKFERRLELAMESDRFFDLVRWGDAESVLNAYYAGEADVCSIYSSANFTKNKNEYLPIPFAQISASNGIYDQNCGGW